MNNQKRLRIGRVYHISPDPIPPYKAKPREAVFVGRKTIGNSKMYVFIQMGSSVYVDDRLSEFNKKTKYFWEAMGRPGYFHLGSSKPEYFRSMKNEYRTGQKYVEMKKGDAIELLNLWETIIKEEESIRWKKAYAYYSLGREGDSLKQLYLLKFTMPWKYKTLKPTEQIKKWTEKERNKH